MFTLEKSVLIDAPVEKIFDFMAEPNHLLEIWPALLDVRNVQPLPNGGYCYEWVYKMAGVRFEGQSETTEFARNRGFAVRNESGIPSTFVWSFNPEEGGTRVTVSVEYAIPGAALGRIAQPVIQKMNEHESETILANLKALIEG